MFTIARGGERNSQGKNWVALLMAVVLAFGSLLSPISPPQAGAAETQLLYEGFEKNVKPAYAPQEVELDSGRWYMDDALIGKDNNPDGTQKDKRTGQSSVRIRNIGSIEMRFDVSGVTKVRLKHANYGTDTGNKWKLQQSTDGGSTWHDVGAEMTPTADLTEVEYDISASEPIRFKIAKTAGTNRINIDDFELIGPDTTPPVVRGLQPQANAANVPLDAAVSVTFDEPVTLVDGSGIAIVPEGDQPLAGVTADVDEQTLTIRHPDFSPDTRYTVTIPGGAVEDLSGNQLAQEISWSFSTGDADVPLCSQPGIKIGQIQGLGHRSPCEEQAVTEIKGVVTARDNNGFYMQDEGDGDPRTSDAIYVFTKGVTGLPSLSVGDRVSVSGKVKEFQYNSGELSFTEIEQPVVNPLSHGNPLPEPVVIGEAGRPIPAVRSSDNFSEYDPEKYAIDYYESLEFMRVQVREPLIVGTNESYREIYMLADRGRASEEKLTVHQGIKLRDDEGNPEVLIIYDKLMPLPDPLTAKPGDIFDAPINGILGYSYGYYNIWHTEELPAITAGATDRSKEASRFVPGPGKLTIATYNVENFSAKDTARAAGIADSIVNLLKAPDIIGLQEVQDNDGSQNTDITEADQTYQLLIDEIKKAGGPEYRYTDIAPQKNQDGGAPGGNIRVGFLYNPERVQLVDVGAKGDATTPVEMDENGNLKMNPGRIQPDDPAFADSRKPLVAQFRFGQEDIFVINNHLNSKSGDTREFGTIQPPARLSEPKRHQQAQVIHDFVRMLLNKRANANVVVLGDLNDFEFSATLRILKQGKQGSGAGNEEVLASLIERLPENERFTYVYKGNSQVLDHILVNRELAHRAEADIVNINAEFTSADGSVSDHDPVVAQIDFSATPVWPLTLMHTNDTHSHLDEIARRATWIKQVREEVPDALLLDAGDVFSGTLYFTKWLGQADLEFMNLLGYNLMTFGNHEFDKGSKVLADFIKGARFPFVSSNVDVTADPDLGPLVQKEEAVESGKIHNFVTMEINGEKVGFIGLTTEDTRNISSPSKETRFNDAVQSAQAAVEALTQRGVNKIIALTHIGFEADRRLAEQVEGLDVIIGGHSHTKLDQMVVVDEANTPTLIVQTGEYGENLGRLDVVFDEAGNVLVDRSHSRLLPVKEAQEDPGVKARIDAYKQELDQFRNEVIGHTAVLLDGERANVRSKETNLGNLITDGMLWKANVLAKEANGKLAEIAITNGGGIRASIQEGEITLGDVLTVMPFGNTLAVADLTGAQIIEALENGLSQVNLENPGNSAGRFPQVSGLKVVWDPSQPAGQRVLSVQVKGAGETYEPISRDKIYRVVTNGFMLNGGDGYTVFLDAKYREDLGYVDYEVFIEYIKHLEQQTGKPLQPEVEGRITIGSKGSQPPQNGDPVNNPGPPSEGNPPPDNEVPKPPILQRIAGSNPYETAIALNTHLPDHSLDTMILATGNDFPDAIAGGTMVQPLNGSVLLLDPKSSTIDSQLIQTIQRLLKQKGRILIIGGTSAIPPKVEQQLVHIFGQQHRIERIAGRNRQETSVNIAKWVNESPEEIFLVNGNHFPDASVIAPLASKNKAPVLLNRSGNELDQEIKDYLAAQQTKRLKKVTIVGGSAAVSEKVGTRLQEMGIQVERIYGADRYLTALEVAKRFYKNSDSMILASGLTYSDVLATSRYSVDHAAPVLLTPPEQLLNRVNEYIQQNKVRKITMIGKLMTAP